MKCRLSSKKRLLTAIGLSANFFLMGCADDQARSQIAATNAQLTQLQETVGVLNTKVSTQKLVDILNKLDELQNQINQLNGEVETLKQNQQEYKKTGDALYQGVEQQIQALQKGGNPTPTTTATPPVANEATAATDDSLKSALQKVKSRNFPQAIKDLKNIISTSDNPETVASASYYLTVAYAANGQFKDAIATGRQFITDNPDNSNVPDAMRTIYISQNQLGMKKSAIITANSLIKDYPDSDAAKKVQKDMSSSAKQKKN
jgi:TolA-binding protein